MFPAPIACDEIVEMVESIDDGTKNKKEIIFSTIPTAAEISTPLLLAIIVIIKNETWINPSCKDTGTPILSTFLNMLESSLKSLIFITTSFFL